MSDVPSRLIASSSQTVGPFFHFGPGAHPELGSLVTAETAGERIALRIRVFDGDGTPVPDAMIEIWQADGNGAFVLPPPALLARMPLAVSDVCQPIRMAPVSSRPCGLVRSRRMTPPM